MSIVVNTNIASLIAQRNLKINTSNLEQSIERLSSGYKINKASDDAAGLSISENLKGQITGNTQASNNIQDGVSMLQIAESSLSVINDNVQRIRELCVQAANDTNSSVEKNAILSEVNARLADINRISKATNFNGISLLDGTANVVLQVGAEAVASTNTISIGNSVLSSATTSSLGLTLTTTGGAWTGDKIREYLTAIDTALNDVSTRRSNLGAYQNRLQSALDNLTAMNENVQAAESRIRDVDVAQESSNMTKYQVLQQASVSVLAQANSMPQIALKLLG